MSTPFEVSDRTAYVTMLQSVISRFAASSASCKQWCFTLVTAVVALALDKGKSEAILVGFLLARLLYFGTLES